MNKTPSNPFLYLPGKLGQAPSIDTTRRYLPTNGTSFAVLCTRRCGLQARFIIGLIVILVLEENGRTEPVLQKSK
jgi:hypothetical protein